MKILLTGGAGAVGGALTAELRRRGHDAWIADTAHGPDPRSVRCDVGSFMQLERVFEHGPFDLVYHLAAEFGRWNGEDYYDTMWRTNAVGTKNVIRLQERLGFRLVFFSSSEVYGDFDGLMSEDAMDRFEIRQLNDYAMSKWVGEQQVMNSAAMHGTQSVRVRLFNTYGPGERYTPYRSALVRFVHRALHGETFPVHRGHLRTWSYVDDTARTLANLAERFRAGEVYNVAGTEEHTMETVAELVLKHTGAPADLARYEDSEPFTTRVKHVDTTKAREHLGHDPQISLDEGIGRTVAWMREVSDLAPAALQR